MKVLQQKMLSVLLTVLAVFTGMNVVFAQGEIKGVVTDSDNKPLAGVSVLVKGSNHGTTTDATGVYTISAAGNGTIIFSMVGYAEREVKVNNQSLINLQLDAKAASMDEVVVTALGIKKDVKRLGYAAQEVKGAELIKAREPNPINGLVGKVAGLTVGISPELLGRPQILLRGKNISLFVVDGVFINSDTWNISPDDIESYTVLKGPTAAALYGYRGQNGAIVITTKKGSKDKRGFSIEWNTSTMFEKGFVAIPKVQDEYGPGDHGVYAFGNGRGGGLNDNDYDVWGPRFEGQLIPQYDSPLDPNGTYTTTFVKTTGNVTFTSNRKPTPWTARGKDNLKRFLQTGMLTTTNLAVASSGEKYDLRFSTSYTYQKGIVPNTKLNSVNFNTTLGYDFTPKLRFETNINYNRQFTPNFPDVVYGPNSMIYNIITWAGADWSVDDMRNYWQPGKEGVQQIYAEYQRYNNPYFITYEWLRGHYKNDVYGYASLSYKFNKQLELMGRTSVTTYDIFRPEKFPYSATSYGREEARGDYREDKRSLFENNTELMLKYNQNVLKDVNISAFVGGAARNFKYNSSYVTTDYLNVPGIYSFANSRNPVKSTSFNSNMLVLSAYYSADITYRNYFTLSTTGRVDKLSTLPGENRTYFYPSAALSTVVSDYVKLPEAISFLKFRTSTARVKSGGLSVQSNIGPTPNASFPLGYGSAYQSSYEGPSYGLAQVYSTPLIYNNTPAAYYTNSIFDPELKPDDRVSYEGGMDIRFVKNRIGLDATYFTYINGPLIFSKPLSQTTGYTGYTTNAVKTKTTGVELTLNGSPIRKKDGLNWDVTVNWSTFREKYTELPPGQTVINTFFRKGDRVDKVYASAFVRTPDGQIINDAGGRPVIYPISQFLGYASPDWVWAVNNKFSWKGISLTLQFDGRHGGIMRNFVRRQNFRGGRHIETIQGAMGTARLEDTKGNKTYLGEGVQISNGVALQYDPVTGAVTNYKDLQYAPNATKTFLQDYISRYHSPYEGDLMSKTFTKLREVIIGYSIPRKVIANTFIKSAEVSFIGRNLGYWLVNKKNKDVDVDQYAGTQSDTDLQSPTTKRFGFNVNLTF
ncbi:SusC/RagA family TonB-linked outer membrane protein [Terrimonas pollutisoli]|uniref:SusC/RagA family TonB-linked outer membrane protein n=1 Tax=Terrimonas pollutisoli TaxID=3034147 RepID=UPI0023ED6210|nr:SusC/RagA family TonB-linked outer membrane protein [Terrimonas sp. H1YJ31]